MRGALLRLLSASCNIVDVPEHLYIFFAIVQHSMNYDGILGTIIPTTLKMGGDAQAHVRSIEFIYIMNFRRSMLAVALPPPPSPPPHFRHTLCAGLWIVESFSGAIKFNEIIFGV